MKTLKDIKKLVKLDDHHNYDDIFRKVSELVETDKTLRSERKDLETLLSANTDFRAGIFDTVVHLLSERDGALTLRESYNSNVEDWRELCSYFNLPVSELSSVMRAIDTMRLERDMLRAERKFLSDLNEIRYVLHGDIQPCTVLYSDDTTTLLRLDEGDIMCETDTIEWSDSVTYRCQELLKDVKGTTLGVLAQLVRDERILLNDDTLDTDGVEVQCCSQCGHEFDETLTICPQCRYEWAGNNSPTSEQQHYTAKQFAQEMRRASRGMVDVTDTPFLKHSPVSLAPWEAPSNPEDTWSCVKCTHRFPSVCDRCPKCNTPKER